MLHVALQSVCDWRLLETSLCKLQIPSHENGLAIGQKAGKGSFSWQKYLFCAIKEENNSAKKNKAKQLELHPLCLWGDI